MTNEPPDDLDGLRSMDSVAITAIHNQYYPEVYRYARYRLNDEAAADDIASEAFLRLLDAVQANKGPKTTLRGWLMGTTANLISDHYRKQYNQPVTDLFEEIHTNSGNPVEWVETSEINNLLHSAIAKLTAEQQHVLALRFGSGYSLEETAAITGKKANAIKALQFRALSALKKLMEEHI
jgi:RNA polymerase sigma factor (sigma-70 family)